MDLYSNPSPLSTKSAKYVAISMLTLSILLAIRYYRKLFYIIVCIPRDIRGAYRYALLKIYWNVCRLLNITAIQLFDRTVKSVPHKTCWYFEDQRWTFLEAQEFSLKVGNFFNSEGIQKDDNVALLMFNRPEYPCFWLGINRIGAKTALINYNLRSASLLHSITSLDCKALIVDAELLEGIEDLVQKNELDLKRLKIYVYDGNSDTKKWSTNLDAIDLNLALKSASKAKLPKITSFYDPVCYVFTSGTTGMPKAAILNSARIIMMGTGINIGLKFSSEDILMTPIPLYHTSGGILATSQPLFYGTSQVILKKFSASQFWDQCCKYNATVAIYLGELCRYLLKQPVCASETKHKLRFVFGNGLKRELWESFQERFKIPLIAEFYGSTEGNLSIVNVFGKVGAVGFIPHFIKPFLPVQIIKVNEETEEIIRDPITGLAIPCDVNEPGEVVGKILKGHPILEFEGYASKESTERKIAFNVLKKGDSVFRSGDIVQLDEYGYIYFKDRCGDTYRWKGENVSTAEVEGVISKICGMNDVAVYGVEIPGCEGKAGMAAIVDSNESLNFQKLAEELHKQLPSYAIPHFIRVCSEISTTGTFKVQKYDLKKEGFNIDDLQDKIFVLSDNKTYIKLDSTLYQQIMNQQVRF